MLGPSVSDALLSLRPSEPHAGRQSFSDEELASMTAAKAALDALLAAAESHKVGQEPSVRIDISRLTVREAQLMDEILGEGEVLVKLADGTRVQESVMPGLWRVKTAEASWLEVADIPAVVREAVTTLPVEINIPAADRVPRDAMNVMPVLHELRDVTTVRAEDPAAHDPHEINLTLLPMTPVDLMVLEKTLGTDGPVNILSKGYGNCRIATTGIRNVWRVMYFNADDKMILHVIQVGDVPAAAMAASDDLADSAVRLRDIIGAYYQ